MDNSLIKRQDAIDLLEKWSGGHSYLQYDTESAIYEFQNLPSAQPEPRWIPCSERLPEESDYIGCAECIDGAVWYYTDKGAMGLGYYYNSTKAWSTTYDEKPYGDVIAWMPLPKGYSGE